MSVDIRSEFIHWELWRTLVRTEYVFVCSPHHQRFGKAGALSTLVTSVVLYPLTRAILMSPGMDETRVCGYTFWIYSLSTLENTDENKIFFCSFTTPQAFWQSSAPGALSTLVTSVVLLVNPSHTDESWEGRNTCMWIYILYICIYIRT